MSKYQFVRFGTYSINPHAVAYLWENPTQIRIVMLNGVILDVPKHNGEIIVNDLRSVESALESAMIEATSE